MEFRSTFGKVVGFENIISEMVGFKNGISINVWEDGEALKCSFGNGGL